LLPELGFEPFQEWDAGRSWKFNDTYLAFVQVKSKNLDIPYNRCRVGLNHLAFHADSRQQVDDLTEQIRAQGMTILYEDRHPHAGGANHYALFFEDPDRIKVEIVAPT
jgi:catechol 2,3-dioxygenase-like lactoylglutathione lyase family enzyme